MIWSLLFGFVLCFSFTVFTIVVVWVESQKNDKILPCVFVIFLTTIWCMYAKGWGMEKEKAFQKQAIEAEIAEWKCDPKTGEKTFTWIPPRGPMDGDLCGRCSEFVEKNKGDR